MESDADVDMEEVPGGRLPVLNEEAEVDVDNKEQLNTTNEGGDAVKIMEAPDWPSYLVNVESDLEKPLFRRLFHWGPIAAMSLTGFIGITSVYIHLSWWPIDDPLAFLNLFLFTGMVYATVYNMVRASYLGGGFVTKGWHPPESYQLSRLQFCAHCNGYKAPRSHHCQKCNRCVMKMDHHCRTKAEYRERDEAEGLFVFPYNLGIKRNIREVFPSFWARIPNGNGIWWPIRSGCTQFTLSEEQLVQKVNKRFYAKIYTIQDDYKGSWWRSWRFGVKTLVCQPCSEEKRIEVKKGESYAITRIQRNWLYGQRLIEVEDVEGPFSENPYAARASRDQTRQEVVKQATQPRGWFPKPLARPKYPASEETRKDV
ncbi:unnamed protein product [Bursaphelenchus okinawaensis]|uniref:Palmitoyltransferase n=1 Tax=Bursaphelenchus okinawaensis TaxID=465554 RepID=A0A811KVJ3_9BILA|nr:unnamed protein product [Bursaphelenchus okinawaensis]CAG9112938.1 unnamed protein product [Bursaphelenchus okinawaensis]